MADQPPIRPDDLIGSLAIGVAAGVEGYLTVSLSFGLVAGAVWFVVALTIFNTLRR